MQLITYLNARRVFYSAIVLEAKLFHLQENKLASSSLPPHVLNFKEKRRSHENFRRITLWKLYWLYFKLQVQNDIDFRADGWAWTTPQLDIQLFKVVFSVEKGRRVLPDSLWLFLDEPRLPPQFRIGAAHLSSSDPKSHLKGTSNIHVILRKSTWAIWQFQSINY